MVTHSDVRNVFCVFRYRPKQQNVVDVVEHYFRERSAIDQSEASVPLGGGALGASVVYASFARHPGSGRGEARAPSALTLALG